MKNEFPIEQSTTLPDNFDPNDPDLGSTYRRDVVRDVTDFRPRGGSSETDQDRISRLEDRIERLEYDIKIIVKNNNKEGSEYIVCKNE